MSDKYSDRRVRKALETALSGRAPGRGRPIKLKLGDLACYASIRKIGRPRKYRQITSADVGKLERVRRRWTIDLSDWCDAQRMFEYSQRALAERRKGIQ